MVKGEGKEYRYRCSERKWGKEAEGNRKRNGKKKKTTIRDKEREGGKEPK